MSIKWIKINFKNLKSSGMYYIWTKFRINQVTGLEIVREESKLLTHRNTDTHTHTHTHTHTEVHYLSLVFLRKAETRLKMFRYLYHLYG